jgi:hypothetical protein
MTQNGKAQIEAIGAGLIGFVVVVGAGALFMFHHGGAVKAPASAYAPINETSGLSAPSPSVRPASAGAPMGESGAVASSPAPILPASERTAAPAAAPAPVAAVAPAVAAAGSAYSRKLVVTQHLDGTSSAHSSAKAVVASAPAARAKPRAPNKPFLAPKLDLTNVPSLAATVHYGVSGRSELMGRAAGPVYNFSGRDAAKSALQAPSSAGTLSKVEAAQQQVDNAPLADSDKQAINANLNQVRQAVSAGSGQ